MALAVAGLVLGAGPAAADAAKPGDFSSEITSIEPAAEGFDIEITGGDSFVTLTVDDGHEVIVEGYRGEPYLRFNADGTVEENRNSQAAYLNSDRYGTNEVVPDDLQGDDVDDLEPDWQQVATGGTFSWHDHRTHWMGGTPPVGRGETFDWNGPLPLQVDGTAVEVTGTITYHEAVSPLPWYLLAVVVLVAFAVVGPKLPCRVPAAITLGVAAMATWVAWVGYQSLPSGTGASIVPTVVGAIALVLAVVALAVDRLRSVGLLASGVFLAAWGVFRLSVLSNPVLPTDAPFLLERLTTALALGVGLGAVVVAFRTGALTLALLPLDEEEAA